MIEVVLSGPVLARLRRELRRAGSDEIGGVLAGESLGDRRFLVVDLSIQRGGGGFAHFVRDSSAHRRFMRRFFARTGHQYHRYNYLGEWHSHPSFPALPSPTDLRQMQQLIEDREQSALFLALLVVKLDRVGNLEASAHAFRRQLGPIQVPVFTSAGSPIKQPPWEIGKLSRTSISWRRESIRVAQGRRRR